MTKQRSRSLITAVAALLLYAALLFGVEPVLAKPPHMHIAEGFLPVEWAVLWLAIALPFWVVGVVQIRRLVQTKPESRVMLALAGAFVFVLSALKLPSVTGSCSHPTGTGLGTILFGPFVMSVLGSVVLLFQAVLLAHGGLTTLGANAVSMGIVGPLVGWLAWRALHTRTPQGVAVFFAAALADLTAYVVTSVQLAVAHPDPTGGVVASFAKFGAIFAVTQIPLAISEGLLTVLIFNALRREAAVELRALGLRVQGA